MASGLSDEERARLADLSRRRSLRLLLVLMPIFLAFGLVGLLISLLIERWADGSDGEPADLATEVALSLVPVVAGVLVGVVFFLHNRADPLLVMGADPAIQRRVYRAVRDGRANDRYVEDLATDLATRQARWRWSPLLYGTIALLALVSAVTGGEAARGGAAFATVASAFAGLAWWIRARRARRFLENRANRAD